MQKPKQEQANITSSLKLPRETLHTLNNKPCRFSTGTSNARAEYDPIEEPNIMPLSELYNSLLAVTLQVESLRDTAWALLGRVVTDLVAHQLQSLLQLVRGPHQPANTQNVSNFERRKPESQFSLEHRELAGMLFCAIHRYDYLRLTSLICLEYFISHHLPTALFSPKESRAV